ncbi:MAG: hypothetical protein K8R46_02835 [Pirellulales bacterium]|nr:hypothetical protein [Pirellulales bacterium]
MIDSTTHTTGYARLTPPQARIVLGTIALVALLGAAVTLSPLGSSNLDLTRNEAGDIALYRAEAERIHRGEGYYQAAAAELAERGYPTQSVFNWRTPLPMWLLGKMPTIVWGKALLGAMAIVMMLLAFGSLAREEENIKPRPLVAPRNATNGRSFMMGRPLACALLLTGPLLPTFLGDIFFLPVLWAGVLIALSVCAYGVHRPWLAVALGLAAVLCRELALPYCILCAAIAWRNGRREELTAWLIGLAAWFVLFGLHWWHVSELIPADARAHPNGWLQLGGAGFVISTAQMNAYLLLLPQWVTALYLVAAMVGLAGWSSPLGTRVGLSVCLYLAAFAAVGQSFNQYWGALIAPLLCFGVVRLPASICDLWRAATRTSALSFRAS